MRTALLAERIGIKDRSPRDYFLQNRRKTNFVYTIELWLTYRYFARSMYYIELAARHTLVGFYRSYHETFVLEPLDRKRWTMKIAIKL